MPGISKGGTLMKKLDFTAGSIAPLWQKDLDFMQNGVAEAFAALLRGLELGADNYLVCGCSITVNTSTSKVSMTAGWCFYDGELLPVKAMPATSFTGSKPKIKLSKTIAYNPEGDRIVSLEGQTGAAQMWKDCYLEPSVAGNNDKYTLALSEGAWTLAERISEMSRTTDTGIVPANITFGIGSISYRRVGGTVQLLGSVVNDATGAAVSGKIASGLPRPAAAIRVPLSDNGYMLLETDGTLTAYNTKLTRVYFDGIMYLTTPEFSNSDGHHSAISNSQQGGGAIS